MFSGWTWRGTELYIRDEWSQPDLIRGLGRGENLEKDGSNVDKLC